MPLNIPLPGVMGDTFGKAIDSGSQMYTRIMQPILEREKQKQLEEHFKQQMALHKQAASRAGALDPMRRMIMEQQLIGLQHKNDPNYEFQQFRNMMNAFGGGKSPVAQQQPQTMPTEEMGEGMGMFSPEGLQDAQQAPPQMPEQQPGQGGINLDALKQNPMLRGFFKHKFGFDPLAAVPQTPEEKANTELKTGATKEQQTLDIKRKDALQDELPQAEKLIKDIEEAKKLINENKNLFGPGIGGLNFLGGPSQRKRGLKTKKEREAWGKIEDLFGTLVGKKATDFSHKGLKVAFDLAANTKPSFEEWPETVVSKLNQMENGLKEGHDRDLQWYKEHGGKVGSKTRLKFNLATGRLE